MTTRPRSWTGAKIAERGPTQTLASPLRSRCHSSNRSPSERAERRAGKRLPEAGGEPGDRLRREADLGDEDDRPAPALERRLDRRQVDLGLARAGDAVEELLTGRVGLAVERRDQGVDRGLLLGQEPGRLDRGVEGGRGGGGARA